MVIEGDGGYMKLFTFTIHEQRKRGYLKMKMERVQTILDGQLTNSYSEDEFVDPTNSMPHLYTARKDRNGDIYLVNFFGHPSKTYLDEEEEMSELRPPTVAN